MKNMIIYLSGSISGVSDYKKRFQVAEIVISLLRPGTKIINPAKIASQLPSGIAYENHMHIDFAMIDIADCIFMLPGWQESPGACRERKYAEAHNIFVLCEDCTVFRGSDFYKKFIPEYNKLLSTFKTLSGDYSQITDIISDCKSYLCNTICRYQFSSQSQESLETQCNKCRVNGFLYRIANKYNYIWEELCSYTEISQK